jgi:glycosyltransferase involved in cell wall biosynthesis
VTRPGTPTISIGVPVYNGEATLHAALESIAAQSFEDFEVVMCDNDSGDGTAEICQEWATRDSRFRYFKNDQNLGAAANFNRAFELSRGEYFKWHAADDLLLPEFLEACIVPLQERQDFVLSYPIRRTISYDGQPLSGEPYLVRYRQPPEDGLDDLSLADLLRICPSRIPLLVFGLIRSSVLAKTALIGAFPSSDVSLVYELRLHGRFAQIPRPLYVQRLHGPSSDVASRMTRKGDASWFGAKGGLAVRSPEAKLLFEMLKARRRASPRNGSGLFTRAQELFAFRAHAEIRAMRSLSILARTTRGSLFDAWSRLSENLLAPDAPNLWGLRLWRGGAAAAKGRFGQARTLLHPRESAHVLTEGLGRLLHRGSDDSLRLFTAWLASEDPEKALLAACAYASGAPDEKARFLAHLDAIGAQEARARLEDLATGYS